MDVVVFSLFIMILSVIAALTGEWWVHLRALKRIPIRIHINGTRGKSSVTRLICAGLREAGFSVLGKTTGSDPRILDLEGKDRKIHRLQKPSIGEQVRFLRYFGQFRPQAVVLECMAVQPQYQWITEQHMVKSTHSVIT
ncbi:MAG: poly-gamma-glutamate synthase PgsB, partial [Candidatus Marinimicrobia bacterium]|nr:poly-gamma-glutamate synthase PgsB [Candidatus Neomarinimicrobiota bacterium]